MWILVCLCLYLEWFPYDRVLGVKILGPKLNILKIPDAHCQIISQKFIYASTSCGLEMCYHVRAVFEYQNFKNLPFIAHFP